MGAGCFDFIGWNVAPFDGCVAPALPFFGWVVLAVAPKVVKPASCAVWGGNEECLALFVCQGGANYLEPDLSVHKCGFVKDYS